MMSLIQDASPITAVNVRQKNESSKRFICSIHKSINTIEDNKELLAQSADLTICRHTDFFL